MREIKFRAWVEYRKTMFDVIMIDWFTESIKVNADEDEEDESFRSSILMQYVGLKDKNGKKICEGDIVCNHVYDGLLGVKPNKIEYGEGYIKGLFQENHDGISLYDLKDIEIIGNIYENPELLN